MCPTSDVPYTSPSVAGTVQLNTSDISDLNLSKSTRTKSSKTEILRISRGRLKDDLIQQQSSQNAIDNNKRKRNSSRENSLESLLEEEDPTSASEECVSRDSLGQRAKH